MNPHALDSLETRRLLEQAQAGDETAFDRLFARHRPFLRQIVEWRMDRELRQRVDASDVVQEAQLEAARRLPRFLAAPPMCFKLWLRQITYDRFLMVRRRHIEAGRRALAREAALPDETSLQLAHQIMAHGPSPSQIVAQGELVTRVRQALERLDSTDREVLVMRLLEGLSTKEIAQALDLESSAVSKRYGRALLRLRSVLKVTLSAE
jgi:RNA polymerase sigma-70 factor, ECF subfamily